MSVPDALRSLGITNRYRGYRCVITDITLVLENEERMRSVVSDVYRETAAVCGCSWYAVERNIRTVVHRAWLVNPQRLSKMAGYPLDGPPTASEFIDILASYIRRSVPSNADGAAPADAKTAQKKQRSKAI